jgi:hypothetical protein
LEALATEDPTGEVGLFEQTAAVTYRRYETSFEKEDLARLGLQDVGDLSLAEPYPKYFDSFARVGRAAAARDVVPPDFAPAFDVRVPVDSSPDLNT